METPNLDAVVAFFAEPPSDLHRDAAAELAALKLRSQQPQRGAEADHEGGTVNNTGGSKDAPNLYRLLLLEMPPYPLTMDDWIACRREFTELSNAALRSPQPQAVKVPSEWVAVGERLPDVTVEEARAALNRFVGSHFGEKEHARFSIPARRDRDDDMILSRFIDQYAALCGSPQPQAGNVRTPADVWHGLVGADAEPTKAVLFKDDAERAATIASASFEIYDREHKGVDTISDYPNRIAYVAAQIRRILPQPQAVNVPSVAGWISVDERLPEDYEMVLVYDPEAGCYVSVGCWQATRWWVEGGFGRITHWRPFPDPPTDGPLSAPPDAERGSA